MKLRCIAFDLVLVGSYIAKRSFFAIFYFFLGEATKEKFNKQIDGDLKGIN